MGKYDLFLLGLQIAFFPLIKPWARTERRRSCPPLLPPPPPPYIQEPDLDITTQDYKEEPTFDVRSLSDHQHANIDALSTRLCSLLHDPETVPNSVNKYKKEIKLFSS